MTYLHMAIINFWSQLEMPVYLQGRAPQRAQFPFVTVNIANPSGLNETTLTAFVWLRDDGNKAYEKRAKLMDEIEKLIPVGGVLLEIQGGYVELYRNPIDFITYYDDPDVNSGIIGARVAYRIRLYSV